MAPTLLGWHRELVCPNCQYPFDVGIDEEGRRGPGGLPELRRGGPRSGAGGRVRRRPRAGAEVPLRLPAAQALGGGRLPLPGRPVAGLRQAGGRPAGRIDPDRRRRRLRRRPDRPQDAGRAAGDADPGPRQPVTSRGTPAGSRAGSSGRGGAIGRGRAGWSRPSEGFVHRPAGPDRRPGRLGDLPALGPDARPLRAGPRLLRLQRRRAAAPRTRSPTWARGAADRGPTRSRPSRRRFGPGPISSSSRIPVGLPGRRSSWCTTASGVPIVDRIATRSTTEGPWPRDRRRWRPRPSIAGSMVAIDGQLLFDPYDYDDPRPGPTRRARSRSAGGATAATLAVSDLRIYPRHLLHRHAGQHPAAGARGCGRPCTLGARRVLRPGRQQPGLERLAVLERAGRSCPARCSWASRSWSTCRARSSRSRSSAGRFTGFPIPGESVTFDRR